MNDQVFSSIQVLCMLRLFVTNLITLMFSRCNIITFSGIYLLPLLNCNLIFLLMPSIISIRIRLIP